MTEIIKLTKETEKQVLLKAVEVLEKGGIIIYPTETCYGIGCAINFPEAIKKIYEIKQRNELPMLVIVDSIKSIKPYANINEKANFLISRFCKGKNSRPLSLIVSKSNLVPKELTKSNEIGFRITLNKFAKQLCKKLGKPLISTSANFHGEKPIYNAFEVKQKFNDKVDLIIDSGYLIKSNPPSTVFNVNSSKVLREGLISEKEIIQALNEGKK